MKTPRLGGLGNNEKKWQLSNSEELRNQVRTLLATVLPGKRQCSPERGSTKTINSLPVTFHIKAHVSFMPGMCL